MKMVNCTTPTPAFKRVRVKRSEGQRLEPEDIQFLAFVI